jgi:hypothetical protein
MGAPPSGLLLLSNGLTFEHCNFFMVWSTDYAYLVIPQASSSLLTHKPHSSNINSRESMSF